MLSLIRLNDIQLLEKWTNYIVYLDDESEFISQLETQELWFNLKQDTSDEDFFLNRRTHGLRFLANNSNSDKYDFRG